MQALKKKNKFFIILIALALVFSTIFSSFSLSSAYALGKEINFDNTEVLDDLTSSTINGKPFDLRDYPFDEGKDVQIISVVEYCYSYNVNLYSNYGLYLYIYNPKGLNFSRKDKANKAQVAVSYDKDGKPNDYEKFSLQFCSTVESTEYKNLFYKFKLVDHKSADGRTIEQRVNNSARRYDISGLELLENGKTLPVEYGVGGTYIFTGYAEGYGPDQNAKNTLSCTVNQLETVSLEVHDTFYRTGEYKTNYRHDLTSVYFAVPNRFLREYGKLQKIKAEWYEYVTTPICVTDDNTVYDMLYPYLGQYTNESTGNNLQLYTGHQELSNESGHYDKYDWAYNCDYTSAINQSCKRISWLFSTNGEDVSDYILSSERIKAYCEEYNKSFSDGYIRVPGKEISHDLFEQTLSTERAEVSYINDDVHHKLVEFDADNTFDMLNYEDTHAGWEKFFLSLFGLEPNDVDQSYKGISPIHIVSDEDMEKDNISSTLLIDGSEEALEEFRNFYDSSTSEDKTVVLFRFAQTDYINLPVIAYDNANGKNLSGSYGNDTYIIQESVFLNFDIIQLTFNKEGVYTVIPVVGNPIDIYNDITIPADEGLEWWEILLIILVALLVLIILWPFLPLIISVVKWLIKILLWIICLPFKLLIKFFKWLIKKDE